MGVALYWLVALSIAIQTIFSVSFFVIMTRKRDSADLSYQPKASVILCLRGTDPFLQDCIGQLLEQEYANYELCVIVDSAEDQSWQVLREFEGHPRLTIRVLHEPRESCSLKCSSLIQAIAELDPTVEVIALCDADTVPHSSWLAELVAPLKSPDVGATTGNRWYMPKDDSCGTAVRYLWNIPAAVNMILLRIAWGGSLAIPRRVIDETGLLEKWSDALCEDTMLYRVLRKHGYRQVFVPSAMMVNRESCTLQSLDDWVPRQLLTAKLYHPSWPATVGYAIVSSLVPFLAVVLFVWGWATSNTDSMFAACLAFAGFELGNFLLVGICEWGVRRQLQSRGAETESITITQVLKLPLWIIASQMISPCWFWKCYCMRKVTWRGIVYDVSGNRISRQQYSVYDQSTAHHQSL